jgi:hypothetical protein
MCVWYEVDQGEERCLPDKERRVLVAQDDGYIEMAYWNGQDFEFDWPTLAVAPAPRVRYWCDLPETPTEDGEAPY